MLFLIEMVTSEKLREFYIEGMSEKYGFYIYPSSLDEKDRNLKFFKELKNKIDKLNEEINLKLLVRAYFTFRSGGVEDFCNYALDTYFYYRNEFQTNPNIATALVYFFKLVDRFGLDYIIENVDKFPSSVKVVLKFLEGGNK